MHCNHVSSKEKRVFGEVDEERRREEEVKGEDYCTVGGVEEHSGFRLHYLIMLRLQWLSQAE